jgi:hypothetical protein
LLRILFSADIVASRHLRHRRARRQGLLDDPRLVVRRPAPPPPTPVSTSSRRTCTGLGASVGSKLDMKRSAQEDRHHHRQLGSGEGGVRAALTMYGRGKLDLLQACQPRK